MFLSHGGRPTKGNGRKRKGVDEYAAENRVDFTSRSIIRDGQLVRILVCRFCCQSIGARSDRIKEHLASKRHQKLKLEAFREAAEAGRDLSQEYSDDSVSGLLPEPPITMLKFPGKALAHLLEGGGGSEGRGGREMTPEEDRKPVMPTPPPLKEHMMGSPPPSMGLVGRLGMNHVGGTPPPSHGQVHPMVRGEPRSGTPQGKSEPLLNHAHSTPNPGNNSIPNGNGASSPPQQLLCVRWGNFDSNIVSMFTKLRSQEHFVDLTLWCEGKTIKCHKMILSACSTYFEKLLTENPNPHPIIFLKDMRFWEITALVEFMYKGEVSIHQEKLQSLLRAAESLQIKGLGSPSASDGTGSNGLDSVGAERDSSGVEEDDGTMDMSTGGSGVSSFGTPSYNHSLHAASGSSLLNTMGLGLGGGIGNMGMDLSAHRASDSHQHQSSPLALSMSSILNNSLSNGQNPAKRRKKETPRRLVDIPRTPIPLIHGYNTGEAMDHGEQDIHDHEQDHEQYEERDEHDQGQGSDDEELTIQEREDPRTEEGEAEEQQGRDDVAENYEEGGLQVDEGKTDSEGEGEDTAGQGQFDDTDSSGALSLRVTSAAERDRLERDRSRKGNPMKKILVGNNNNNNNNNEGTIYHSPTAAE